MTPALRSVAAAISLAVLMLLAVASVTLAKEGMALLDTAMPSDPPGTSVDLGFVVTLGGPDGQDRLPGANAFVRVKGASGDTLVAWATEQPAASGHYVASFAVPDGGIRAIEVGLADPDCSTVRCANNGFLLEISDQLSGFRPAAGGQPQPAAQPASSTAPASTPYALIVVLVAIGAVITVVAVVAVVRRDLLPLRRGAKSA